jgi:hypothetical protein
MKPDDENEVGRRSGAGHPPDDFLTCFLLHC